MVYFQQFSGEGIQKFLIDRITFLNILTNTKFFRYFLKLQIEI